MVIVSGPGALPLLKDRKTILSSAMVKGESQSMVDEGDGGMGECSRGAHQTFCERYSAKTVARWCLAESFPCMSNKLTDLGVNGLRICRAVLHCMEEEWKSSCKCTEMNCFLSLEADFLILLRIALSSGVVRSEADWNEDIRERVESDIHGFLAETGRVGMKCLCLSNRSRRNSDCSCGVFEFQMWEL